MTVTTKFDIGDQVRNISHKDRGGVVDRITIFTDSLNVVGGAIKPKMWINYHVATLRGNGFTTDGCDCEQGMVIPKEKEPSIKPLVTSAR